MPVPKELFVSHASRDRPLLKVLTKVLEQHRVPHWYSTEKLLGAQQWHDEIGAALKRCDWFMVVLTPATIESMWVKRELLYALDQKRFDGRIIPFVAKPCDPEALSWTLGGLQRIDCRSDFERGYEELLRIWGIEYKRADRMERRKK